MHAYAPPVSTGRFADRRRKRAMEVMVRNVELVRDGADIVDRAVLDARLYGPDSLLN